MQLPDVWGQGGALFAFSGFDGQTDSRHPFVGATSAQGRGIDFYTDTPISLRLRLPALSHFDASDEVVSSDVISSKITTPGCTLRFRLIFADKDTVVGEVRALQASEPVDVAIAVDTEAPTINGAGTTVTIQTEAEEFSLAATSVQARIQRDGATATLGAGESLQFSFAYSSACGSSQDTAERGSLLDQDKLFEERLSFFRRLPEPTTDDSGTKRTYCKCASVQKVNCCSAEGDIRFDWTTPDRWPHKHMWLWDSAFHALGLRHISPDWARNAIKAVLSKQRPNGFIPHKMIVEDDQDSDLIQPPLLAWAAWKVHELAPDDDFLQYCYPKIKNMVLYDCSELDKYGTELSEWDVPKYASGMDNSPRFDQPIGKVVDLNSYLINEMECLEKMAQTLGLPEDARLWSEMRGERIAKLNELLWNEEDGFYYDLNPDGEQIRLKTVAGFTPLFAGVCSDEQASVLVKQLTDPNLFWRPLPVPSVAADEPSFSDDMWRGPVWVNFNYFIIEGLRRYGYDSMAAELRDKTLREIARWYERDGVIYEFYDSEASRSPSQLARKGQTGIHVGGRNVRQCIRDYHWTAALFVDLVLAG